MCCLIIAGKSLASCHSLGLQILFCTAKEKKEKNVRLYVVIMTDIEPPADPGFQVRGSHLSPTVTPDPCIITTLVLVKYSSQIYLPIYVAILLPHLPKHVKGILWIKQELISYTSIEVIPPAPTTLKIMF